MQKNHNKIWRLAQANPALQEVLARELGISRVVAQVLINRGVLTVEEARAFLHNDLTYLHDPFLLKGMDVAVHTIVAALLAGEKIMVFGDYDVDGITGSTLLVKAIRKLGGQADYYLPDRLKEGYGLNKEAVTALAGAGYKLLVTVDCGISCPEEVELAARLGMKVVITDHHEPPVTLPAADAVINPKQQGCPYPFKELAGVGVAFKLAQGLYQIASHQMGGDVLEFLDLVALGTIADIVPLKGENRLLVKYGLPRLGRTSRPGLQALIEVCGLAGKEITPGQVGFILAPRLNAAGRMGTASLGVELLLTEEEGKAVEIARLLDEENARRQQKEEEIFQEAVSMVEEQGNLQDRKLLVMAGAGWHSGVIGIVASRLVEKYYRPTVLISIEDGIGKGSARSIPGFNIHQAIAAHQDFLDKFGGHHQAAGFSIQPGRIPGFCRALEDYAQANLAEELLVPQLELDAVIDLQEVSFDLLEELELLAPFGHQNPGPVMACCGAPLLQCQGVGNNGLHLKLKVGSPKGPLDGIAFNLGAYREMLATGEPVDLAFAVDKNIWQGRTNLQLQVKDIKPSAQAGNQLFPEQTRQQSFVDRLFEDGLQGLADDDGILKRTSVREPGGWGKVSLVDRREHANKNRYLAELLANLANRERALVYVATPIRAAELAASLREKHSNLREQIIYGHGRMAPETLEAIRAAVAGGQIKALVVTPAFPLENIQLLGLAHIVLYSLPVSWAEFNALIKTPAGGGSPVAVHLLFGSRDIRETENLLNLRAPERDFLGKLYLYLRAAGTKQNPLRINAQELVKALQQAATLKGVRSGGMRAALTILEELNLIRTEEKGSDRLIRLLPVPGSKLDLEQSPAYRQGNQAKNHFHQFHQLVLNTPIETLANLIQSSL